MFKGSTPAARYVTGRRPLGHKMSTATRVGLVITFCFAAFLVTRSEVVSNATLLDGPPGELLGTWETDDARYEDRGFEILLDAFHLQVGPDDIRGYPLRETRGFETEAGMTYELTYLTEDGESVHRMTIGPDGRGHLDRPQDVVWTRTRPSAPFS